jgi:hypothetical protein
MRSRFALTLLLLALAAPCAHAGDLRGPVTVSGERLDVSFVDLPKCSYFPSGYRIEDPAQLKRLVAERCNGAAPPAVDLARRSIVALHVSLDCQGTARIVVRRDDRARLVQIHTTRFDGGCCAMGRGGSYWISMPKVPAGYPVVLTDARVERRRTDGSEVEDQADREPTTAGALARAAAALVTIETSGTALDGQRTTGRASGFVLGKGRVATSAVAMKRAVSARVRRPGSAEWLPVAGVAGLDLVRGFAVLDVPGLAASPVSTAEPPGLYATLFVPSLVASPGPGASDAILFDDVSVRAPLDHGLVELYSHVAPESRGAPALDPAGRVVGIATGTLGHKGYTGSVVPAPHLASPSITTRMPIAAAGYLARTDVETAGFVYGSVRRVVETVRAVGRDAPERVSEWTYDRRGMLLSRFARTGEHVHEVEYDYDARGLITLVTERDSRWRAASRGDYVTEAEAIANAARYAEIDVGPRDVAVNTYEYIYDRLSHWTRRTTRTPRGDVVEVAERAIEYYD